MTHLLNLVRTSISSSTGQSGENNSPFTRGLRGFPNSPSFSDFSLGLNASEAEKELSASCPPTASHINRWARDQTREQVDMRRGSLDSSAVGIGLSPRKSLGFLTGAKHSLLPCPLPEEPKAPISPQAKQKREQKIDGLDYWSWNELIRSNSL